MVMDPPLRFSIRPSPVRVRLPKHAIGYSPAARSLGWRKSLRRLWATVLGRGPAVSDTPDRGSRLPPAERLAEVMEARATPRRSVAAKALHELAQVDLAVYRAIAGTSTPTLDEPLRRLSGLANHSKLWVGAAAALFALGGSTRAKGSGDRDRRAGHQLGRRQPADEAGEQAGAPGPRRGRCAGGAPRTDADLHLVPVGPLGVGVRVRRGRGQGRCRCSAHRCAVWPRRSPTRACTRACTTRATSSSGRSSGRRSARRPCSRARALRRRRHRT